MVSQISVVINTLNESRNIKRVIESLDWADELVVVDDGSEDKTIEILNELKTRIKKLKVFQHQGEGYVEPARNYAISKASNEWILILDADEVITETLSKKLVEIVKRMKQIDYVRIPRKNIIFGHFIQESMWWPDYNIRFFKKGKVRWSDKIHRPPEVLGQGLDLPAEEKNAIIHCSYGTISEFLERMNGYTTVQAAELKKNRYKFDWKDLFEKPLNEFLSRFFANRGYKDGLHGLVLSFLQAFSFLVVYLKLWESNNFKEQDINLTELKDQINKSSEGINYWIKKTDRRGNFFERIFKR
ncbi:glycosyltransferase family 2 protein [Candidatus Daviesbacteria bacterium]|nr:glycosyltransferase family 2 protein [Candidatus Daviesbacteria bacterium]